MSHYQLGPLPKQALSWPFLAVTASCLLSWDLLLLTTSRTLPSVSGQNCSTLWHRVRDFRISCSLLSLTVPSFLWKVPDIAQETPHFQKLLLRVIVIVKLWN